MDRKLTVIALCLTLFSAGAVTAGSASGATTKQWSIEGKTLTARGIAEESTSLPEKPLTVSSPGFAMELSCTVNGAGKLLAGSKGEATIKLFNCTMAPKSCTVFGQITITNAPSELSENKSTGALYEIFKPQAGKPLTTIVLKGEECPLPPEIKVTGELAGQLESKELAEQTLKFSTAISEAAGTALFFNTKAGSYNGTAIQKLSGANSGKKWGACGACDYTKEESYGGGNPGAPGVCNSCTGDPIDVATGNFSEEQADIPALGGRGPALRVTRSYNAQLAATQTESGLFGYGWTGSYGAYLVVDEGAKTATVHHDNGSAAAFAWNGTKYAAPPWVQAKLAKEGTGHLYTLPNQTKLEFNSSGQLVKETDRHGNALTLTYKEGHLETVKDAAGRTLTFSFKEGHMESVKDPLGHTVKYAYESGNLVKVTLPGETEPNWVFKYDASHRLTEVTDGRGHTTKNAYDASSRVTLQTDPLARELKLEYKEAGGIKETTITEPNGSKTVQAFNAAGEPTSVTRASGTGIAATTKYEYDNALHRTAMTDPGSHTTTYGYDAEGNRTSEKDPNGNETKWGYNSTHDVTEETTPKGEKTTITRNAAGDPETIKRPAPGATTQESKFKYAANGDLEEETDPLGRKTKYEYDAFGNRKAQINPEEDKRTWAYNEDGQVIAEVSPRGNEAGATASEFETKTERDTQGRPTKITDPLGHETKLKYDANGNLEVQTNQNGHATTYTYDAADQRTEIKASNGDITKTAYDAAGEVKSKTDANAHTTTYERNLLEQVTEVIDPLTRKTTKTYDAAGNLKEVKDPEGRTVTYAYDAGDRLKEVNYSEAATHDVVYEYGKDDEVTTIKDGTGTLKYAYDELDRLTEVETGNKEVVKYAYDLGNQITKITYPNGKSITRAFDKAGRLEKVTDWLGKETKFLYNRNSLPKTTTFPAAAGNTDEYEYNRADQLSKTTMKKGAETLASIAYARDNVGQLKSATQTGLPGAEKPEYEYDEKERLKKGAGTSFEYDPADSPTKLGASTFKYDKASQLEEGGGVKYTFDNLGQRITATPETDPATTYGYDQAGNLISIKRSEKGAVKKIEDTYAYDGLGLRASETINGTTTHMVWDATEKLPLLLSDGTNSYIYGPEGLPFEQVNSKEEASYLHHDQQGSTRLITNSSGEAKGSYTYTPYGATEGHTGAATTALGYNGQYTSADTGLIYLRARVYDPDTAQFLSVDPLVDSTGQTYGYAMANPVNASDPSGEAVLGVLTFPIVTGWMTVPVATGWTMMPVVTGWAPVLTPTGVMMTPLFSWWTVPVGGWVTMPVVNWVSMPVLVGTVFPMLPPVIPRRPAAIAFDEHGEVMLGLGPRAANGEEEGEGGEDC